MPKQSIQDQVDDILESITGDLEDANSSSSFLPTVLYEKLQGFIPEQQKVAAAEVIATAFEELI
jgi:hypothetical protein